MTDHELRLELAKRLPDLIFQYLCGQPNLAYTLEQMYYWKSNSTRLADTEWLHVCHLIEQKMTTAQFKLYVNELAYLTSGNWSLDHYDTWIGNPLMLGEQLASAVNATWQQRAEAIIKVMPDCKTPTI